jgi:hypothetical protein
VKTVFGRVSASRLKIVGDWKIDRDGSSRRVIDICRLGNYILLHIFGINIARKQGRKSVDEGGVSLPFPFPSPLPSPTSITSSLPLPLWRAIASLYIFLTTDARR